MKLISHINHGILDYITIAVFALAPSLVWSVSPERLR